MNLKRLGTLLILLAFLTGCAGNQIKTSNNRIIAAHHNAAKYLVRMAGNNMQAGSRMIAASFVDINNLNSSSTFGRMATQQLVSQFTLEGYTFVEVLLRNSLYIDNRQGEFLLSRELNEISTTHDAPIVLVGTYATTDSNVFVTARLIRTTDNVIIASYDYAVPHTRDMRDLLRPLR
jgi:TolB-like protein